MPEIVEAQVFRTPKRALVRSKERLRRFEGLRRAVSLEAVAPDLGKIERACRFLVRSHQGVLRQQAKPSFSVAPGERSRDSVRIWNRLPEHFGAARERLKNTRILNRDALAVIRRLWARSGCRGVW